MALWMVHPQRGPWMSPWATELALTLGRIPAAESAEMTSAMQRGMEALHLVGNGVFLVGALGVLFLARGTSAPSPHHDLATVRWASAGVVLQTLHTLEHVLLTSSLFSSGRAIGLSTWFGALDGTMLSTQRIWWHGLVNLFASAIVARAAWLLLGRALPAATISRSSRRLQPQSTVLASMAVVIVVPTILAGWVGDSGSPETHAHTGANVGYPSPDAPPGLYDVAAAVGLDVTHDAFHWDVTGDPVAMMGGGVCWIDVDGDGWLDVFVTNTWSDGEWGLWNNGPGLPTTRMYRNVEGRFIDATQEWGAGFAVRAVGCTTADVDADGDTDLYVTTSRSNLLLLNQEGQRFEEVGERSGTDLYGWQAGAAVGDLDGDGLLDIFVAGYADLNAPRSDSDSGFPNTVEPLIDSILFGRGVVDGVPRFEEADVRQFGIEAGGADYGLDVVLIDIDGDRDLDIHVANDTQANRLYRNDLATTGVFVDIAPEAGLADVGSGMGVAIADVNADAAPDVAVTNLAGQGHRLFVSASSGWEARPGDFQTVGEVDTGWGVAFADLDNDGVVDVAIASGAIPIVEDTETLPIRVLRGSDAGFRSWDFEQGAPALPSANGRGVAPADFDNDGDLDIAVSSVGGSLVLLENRLAESDSLTLDLGAPVAGTEVTITFDDGSVQTVRRWSGGHWLSSGDPRIHVGLGTDRRVASIEVRWPTGESASTVVPSNASSVRLSGRSD